MFGSSDLRVMKSAVSRRVAGVFIKVIFAGCFKQISTFFSHDCVVSYEICKQLWVVKGKQNLNIIADYRFLCSEKSVAFHSKSDLPNWDPHLGCFPRDTGLGAVHVLLILFRLFFWFDGKMWAFKTVRLKAVCKRTGYPMWRGTFNVLIYMHFFKIIVIQEDCIMWKFENASVQKRLNVLYKDIM